MFVLVGVLFLGPICIMSKYGHSKSLNSPAFSFRKDVTVLVAGDSHAETAINPALLPHAENIACSAENYFYTYYKLRHFLERNRQITTVVLAFSWHNFPRNYQESFLFGDVPSKIDKYFPLLDQEGRDIVKSWKSSYLVPWLRYTAGLPLRGYLERFPPRKMLGMNLTRDDFAFFGGYRKINKSNINQDEINSKLKLYFDDPNGTASESSSYLTEYLDKIIRLCSEHNVTVVLFNAPVYKDYRNGVPAGAIKSFDTIRMKITSKYSNVRYIDYSNMNIPAKYFSNGDHVNALGAVIVTKSLKNIL
jgi:hypothetical protein